jgi:hypothetical protein
MGWAKVFNTIRGVSFIAGLSIRASVFAAPEPTTPASPFTVGSATAATVTSYSPVIGDNGQYPSMAATIYNLFGANNTTVETGSGDIIFGDQNSQPNTVDFTTPSPVSLIGVAVYLDSDDGTLDGPRSVGTFTFTAGSEEIVASPVNESIAVNLGVNVFMFSQPVSASIFSATFSANPNLNFTPDGNNDGVGPRIYELDGIVPEPASLGILAFGTLALLARSRVR